MALAEPVVATAGVPVSEAVVSCTLGALLFVPVLLFTGFATATWVAAAVSVTVTGYLVWGRRVVVGKSYIAGPPGRPRPRRDR